MAISAIPLELVNAITSVGTLVLVAATVLAAITQLRHMRAGNELAASLALERDFRRPDLQGALAYVNGELAARMEDRQYRAELAAPGYIDPSRHPEMILCNWFDRAGALIRVGLLNERMFFDSFDRLVIYYWGLLAPAVAVLRRTRGPGQYAGFEYLAYRAQLRQTQRQNRPARSSSPRTAVADPWLAEDSRRLAEDAQRR